MDWSHSEMQEAIKELGAKVLATSKDPWADLVSSELTALKSFLDICSLLIEVGRTGGRVPAFETLVLGAPITKYSDLDLSPETVLTAGLIEAERSDPREALTECRDGLLYGKKVCVPAVAEARYICVPATDGVYAVALKDCEVEAQVGTNLDGFGIVTMDGSPGTRLGGDEIFDWWLPRVEVGLSALLLGLSAKALQLTAAYVVKREQFNRPIGSFQAVQQRAADCWIDEQVMEVSLWSAAWRVEEGLDSTEARAVCRYFAAEGSHRICSGAQHLHGGFGFDRDYELHRYFLTARQWEFLLGGAEAQLERLGDQIASAHSP